MYQSFLASVGKARLAHYWHLKLEMQNVVFLFSRDCDLMRHAPDRVATTLYCYPDIDVHLVLQSSVLYGTFIYRIDCWMRGAFLGGDCIRDQNLRCLARANFHFKICWLTQKLRTSFHRKSFLKFSYKLYTACSSCGSQVLI
jgi:hypothetical protein